MLLRLEDSPVQVVCSQGARQAAAAESGRVPGCACSETNAYLAVQRLLCRQCTLVAIVSTAKYNIPQQQVSFMVASPGNALQWASYFIRGLQSIFSAIKH